MCVGADTVADLLAWRRAAFSAGDPWILRTRNTPRRAAELLAGGSLFRVYKGVILSRQRILAVARVGEGKAARCEITLDAQVVLTTPTPRRAFQGWRYLPSADAPPDLSGEGDDVALPQPLARQLREIGAW
ncbi:MAG: DUF1489 domain-containing protein [Caulobacteraceae bacterium]